MISRRPRPTHTSKTTVQYQLVPLTSEEADCWDELIVPYEDSGVFQRKAWLDYLAASRGLDIRLWTIHDGRQAVGYFCGGILRKGPFKILGSPLKSWGTNAMGPALTDSIDPDALLDALDRLAHDERLAMIELESRILPERALESARFEGVSDWTYIVTLTPEDPDLMWRALNSTCRNRIRKAIKAGLTVEDTDDPAFVDEYYEQFSHVMRRKGAAPPFPRKHPQLLFSYLRKADSLFALRVRDKSGRVLATGLFPHDERKMYFWSGASLPESHGLCPNDYLHWRAMCLAADRGLRVYNMSGRGRFKQKFGGELTMVTRWHKCYWRSACWARGGYEAWFRIRTRVKRRRTATLPPHTPPCPPGAVFPRRPFKWSDIWQAPLHDFPIRDEALYQYFSVSPDMSVLEVGPGSGITAFWLARHVRQLTLLDVAPGTIAHLQTTLRAVGNLRFLCADICKPGLAETVGGNFDAAYALEVFELLPDPGTCLQNLAAMLRAGGQLVLQFPNYPMPKAPGPTSFRTRADLDELLREAGFEHWAVYGLRLRPYADFLYHYLHERPLRLYRRLRAPHAEHRPLNYDQSWTFQHGRRLQPYKYLLHGMWAALSTVMRVGGDCFEHKALGDDILNHNLLVLARR